MSAPRFYVDLPLSAPSRVLLPVRVAHHAVRVLRLRPGDALTLFNGQGGEYEGTLELEGDQAFAEIARFDAREAESPLAITLAQALPSGDKMDWIIEKAVELGVAAIQPLHSARSVLRLSGERMHNRLTHWQSIAIAASE